MNKRGSLQDLLFVMVILLTLAITIVVAVKVARDLDDNGMFDNRGGADYHDSRIIYNNTLFNVIPQFDNIFVGVLVAGVLGTIILGFATRSLTVFFAVGFVFTIIMVMIAAIISNVYDEVADNAQLADTSDDFTAIEFIMSNLPLVILISAVLVSIVIYGLWRVGI
jgi:hypothetical protein